jgi:hypothetical protein
MQLLQNEMFKIKRKTTPPQPPFPLPPQKRKKNLTVQSSHNQSQKIAIRLGVEATPVILALGRPSQEDPKFKVSLDYIAHSKTNKYMHK